MTNREEELAHQERIWEQRRKISGHGALDGLGRPKDEPLIVMVAGPIGYWWDDNWMSPEHIRYDEWRTKVVEGIVAAGHLAFQPHQAFKGTWTNRAQVVNNAIVTACDVVLDLTPWGVPSEGTETEVALARKYGKRVIPCPPGPLTGEDLDEVLVLNLQMMLRDIALDKEAQV